MKTTSAANKARNTKLTNPTPGVRKSSRIQDVPRPVVTKKAKPASKEKASKKDAGARGAKGRGKKEKVVAATVEDLEALADTEEISSEEDLDLTQAGKNAADDGEPEELSGDEGQGKASKGKKRGAAPAKSKVAAKKRAVK